jgi:hypothetical protein
VRIGPSGREDAARGPTASLFVARASAAAFLPYHRLDLVRLPMRALCLPSLLLQTAVSCW